MELGKQASRIIFTEKCAAEYFIKFNLFDSECFKVTLSKCLGLTIILGSIFVKLPQIAKIYKSQSGQGISLISVLFDLTAITIFASYNFVNKFPFSSWGDSGFLAIQTAVIAYLVLFYSGEKNKAFIFSIIYFTICFVATHLVPVSVLWTMQFFNIPILLFGKLTQAYVNYKNGSTGQLSAVTVVMIFAGSLARIFTSIQETGDSMVIVTMISSCFANAIIFTQMVWYWNIKISLKQE